VNHCVTFAIEYLANRTDRERQLVPRQAIAYDLFAVDFFARHARAYLCFASARLCCLVYRPVTVAFAIAFLADRTNGRAIGTLLRPSSSVTLCCVARWLNG